MNSHTRNIQPPPKKNYEGVYVSNLEEDLDTDIFALHEAQSDSKTTKPGPSQRTSNRPFISYGGIGNSGSSVKPKNDPVKTTGVSRTSVSHLISNAGPTSSKDASTPTSQNDDKTQNYASTTSAHRHSAQNREMTKRQTDALKNDVERQSSVTHSSVNQRRQAPTVQIAQRSHVTPRKMDVKGYGHETEDLVVQNLDEGFFIMSALGCSIHMKYIQPCYNDFSTDCQCSSLYTIWSFWDLDPDGIASIVDAFKRILVC